MKNINLSDLNFDFFFFPRRISRGLTKKTEMKINRERKGETNPEAQSLWQCHSLKPAS